MKLSPNQTDRLFKIAVAFGVIAFYDCPTTEDRRTLNALLNVRRKSVEKMIKRLLKGKSEK